LSKSAGWAPYPTTFLTLCGGVVLSGILYAIFGRK
jgi:hypothetical protein